MLEVASATWQRRDDDARQAVFALETRHEVFENGNIDDQPPGLVRHDLAPVFDAWRIDAALARYESPQRLPNSSR